MELKCKAGQVWPNVEDNKFNEQLKESPPDAPIKIVNKQDKQLQLEVEKLNAVKPEVGKEVKIMSPLEETDDTKRNKWIVTKHHVEKKDWFTLKNEAYGYFLTCLPKNQKQPIVSYEVPGIHIKCYWLSVKVHTMN